MCLMLKQLVLCDNCQGHTECSCTQLTRRRLSFDDTLVEARGLRVDGHDGGASGVQRFRVGLRASPHCRKWDNFPPEEFISHMFH